MNETLDKDMEVQSKNLHQDGFITTNLEQVGFAAALYPFMLISATFDKDGTIIDGDAEAVSEVNDVWTFARDVRSRDPNWKLIATEAEQ